MTDCMHLILGRYSIRHRRWCLALRCSDPGACVRASRTPTALAGTGLWRCAARAVRLKSQAHMRKKMLEPALSPSPPRARARSPGCVCSFDEPQVMPSTILLACKGQLDATKFTGTCTVPVTVLGGVGYLSSRRMPTLRALHAALTELASRVARCVNFMCIADVLSEVIFVFLV